MNTTSKIQVTGNTLGRCALASLFILGGVNKILNYESTLASMTDVGLSPAGLLLPIVIVLELGAGFLIALKLRGFQLSAITLAVFTLATNYFFHDFWTIRGEVRELELSLFFKNIAIAGALLFVATAKHNKSMS